LQAWPSAINPHPSRIANAILERDAFDFIDDESRGLAKVRLYRHPKSVHPATQAHRRLGPSKASQKIGVLDRLADLVKGQPHRRSTENQEKKA
jgi:hypothetical protein